MTTTSSPLASLKVVGLKTLADASPPAKTSNRAQARTTRENFIFGSEYVAEQSAEEARFILLRRRSGRRIGRRRRIGWRSGRCRGGRRRSGRGRVGRLGRAFDIGRARL